MSTHCKSIIYTYIYFVIPHVVVYIKLYSTRERHYISWCEPNLCGSTTICRNIFCEKHYFMVPITNRHRRMYWRGARSQLAASRAKQYWSTSFWNNVVIMVWNNVVTIVWNNVAIMVWIPLKQCCYHGLKLYCYHGISFSEIFCYHSLKQCCYQGIKLCCYHALKQCGYHGLKQCCYYGLKRCCYHGMKQCGYHGLLDHLLPVLIISLWLNLFSGIYYFFTRFKPTSYMYNGHITIDQRN